MRASVLVLAMLTTPAAGYCPTCNVTNSSTYYESYAPFSVSEPLSCPPHSAIRVSGATSVENCTCVTGYKKTGTTCAAQSVASTFNSVLLPGVAAAIGGGMFSLAWLQAALPVAQPGIFVGVKIG